MTHPVFLMVYFCLVRVTSYFHQRCIVDCLIWSENFKLLLWVFSVKTQNMLIALMGYWDQICLFCYYFAVKRNFFMNLRCRLVNCDAWLYRRTSLENFAYQIVSYTLSFCLLIHRYIHNGAFKTSFSYCCCDGEILLLLVEQNYTKLILKTRVWMKTLFLWP